MMPGSNPARALVLALLGPGGEAGARAVQAATRELDREAWEAVLELVDLHGLGALAASRAGDAMPEPVRRALEPGHRRASLHTLLLLETAARAREALRSAGIPSLLYKGGALVAGGAYREPGARPMDDVDLVVPPDRAREAVGALVDAGFRPWTEWSASRIDWADSAAFDDPASPGGMPLTVDLHWRTEYGALRFGDPSGGSVLWEGAETEAGVPAPEPHLVVVAEHVLKHLRFRSHLHGLADLGLLAARVRDWERVAAILEGRRLAHAVGVLLEGAALELEHPIPRRVPRAVIREGWAARKGRGLIRPSRLLGRRRPVDGRAAGLLFRWLLAGSSADVLRDVAEAAFPDRGWLRARYGGEGAAGPGPLETARLWLRYLADVGGWLVYRRRSPASPHQSLFHPRDPS